MSSSQRAVLTTNEVQDLLGISKTALYSLIRAGNLRTVRFTPKGKYRILREEIDRFLSECTAPQHDCTDSPASASE